MRTSQHKTPRRSGRGALLLAAAALALTPGLAAAQQAQQAGERPGARATQSWALDLRTTYTDNYRRLPDELPRTVIVPRVIGPFVVPTQIGQDTVEIDPPGNVVLTAALSGASVYERPGLTGVISGSVNVNGYTDDSSIDERLDGTLQGTALDPTIADELRPGEEPFLTFGRSQSEEIFIQPNIVGSASVRLVEDLFFVDASALAQQQALSRRADLEAESAGQLGDQTTYVGGSVSPYLSREIGGAGIVELRYRASAVVVADEQFESRFDPTQPDADEPRFGNDSVAQEVLAEYRSDDLLDRFEFAVRASAQTSEEDGSDVLPEVSLDRVSTATEAAYEVNRAIGLTARLGYDEVDIEQRQADGTAFGEDEARSESLSGTFWSVGVQLTPSNRTRLDLSVGERFGGTLVEGSLQYRPTPRLRVNARAARELGTGLQDTFTAFQALNSQALATVEALGRLQDDSRQRLLDRAVALRGATGRARIAQGGLSVRNTYSGGANFDAGRTSLSAQASFEESEFAGLDGGENTNQVASINLAAQRQVSRRLSVTARARVLYTDGGFFEDAALGGGADEDRSTTQGFASLDGAYRIGPRLSATARVYRSQRDTDQRGRTGTRLDFEENAASVGIRLTF